MRLHRLLLGGCLLIPAVASAGVVLTVEAPGLQTSQVSGVTTETFDSLPLGTYSNTTLSTSVGVITGYSPGFAIVPADQYGGAGGTGRYFAVGVQSGPGTGQPTADLSLAFGTPQAYLGLWFSALDSQNVIELYSGSTLLATYDAPAVSTAIGLNAAYKGNPTAAFFEQNKGEPYAYLNFIGTGGTTFTGVRFRNTALWSGLELDNFSIRQTPLESNPGTEIPGGVTVVPLPAAVWSGMALLGCLGSVTAMRRRKA